MQQPNYYAIIPANVRYADISANAKLIYGEITALADKKGYAWFTNEWMAKNYKSHPNSISRNIKELVDLGVITLEFLENDKGVQRLIRIASAKPALDEADVNPPLNNSVNTPLNNNVNPPINKIVKDNTTRVNTTREEYTPLPPEASEPTTALVVCDDKAAGFEDFWQAYPAQRRENKRKCLEYWVRDRLAAKTEQIVNAVGLWKQSRRWTSDGGRYICHPQKFLNQRMYEDEDLRAMMIATTKQAHTTDIMDLLIADQEAKEAQGNGNG